MSELIGWDEGFRARRTALMRNAWYSSQEIEPGVTLIRETRLKPEHGANIWHVRGSERDLVVDTGFGFTPLRPAFPFIAGAPSIAVATHTHCDHIGGMAEFELRAVHRLEAHVLANPTRAETLLDKALSAESFIDNAPPDGLDVTRHEIPAAPATIVLEDGDVIDLGDKCFRTLHVPGHSPGGLALFDEVNGILFSGDMLHAGPGGIGRYVWHHSCPAEFLESVRRLRDLAPRIILAGHFDPFGLPTLEMIVEDYERHHAVAHAGR